MNPGKVPRAGSRLVVLGRYRPGMDASVLIPTLGTVIVAALGFWLQDRRARGEAAERERTAEREATERRETAEREAEAARLAHLLEERRAAYVGFVQSVVPWITTLQRRVARGGKGLRGSEETGWRDTELAVAAVDLVAPTTVRTAAHALLVALVFADTVSRPLVGPSERGSEAYEAFMKASGEYRGVLKAMNNDLMGTSN